MASTNQLEKILKNQLKANSHSNATSKVSALVRGVIEFFNLGERLDKATVLKVAEKVWTDYVVPYDWPYVDGAIERWLEDQAWKMAALAIGNLVDKFADLDSEVEGEEVFKFVTE